jgi:DnaJ-class molecular chaperone
MAHDCRKCRGTGVLNGKWGNISCYRCHGTGYSKISFQCSAPGDFVCPYKYDVDCKIPLTKTCKYIIEVTVK